MGVSFDAILDEIRDNMKGSPERIHLTNRRDLKNIEREFQLHHHLRLHDNDAVSVDIWVKNMTKLGIESPVLKYKSQGMDTNDIGIESEDFILILMTPFQADSLKKFGSNIVCVDSTHGTTNYDFLLTTLVVVDEYGEGIPVAYLISNRVDTAIIGHFFHTIVNNVGPIKASVFMSDDDPIFYNAWSNIMPKPQHNLLCAWHVDRSWRKQLQKVKGTQENKSQVYKCVRLLLQSTDEEEFKALLKITVQEFLGCETTRDFGNYFNSHYANRPQQWAYCYRKGLGINTNMYLESFHKILKHVYLEGRKGKRVDRVIHALMRINRDKLFNRLHQTIKGKSSYRVKLIEGNHQKSKFIDLKNVFRVSEENNAWLVPSSDNTIRYTVSKESDSCLIENCQLKCAVCKVCIHLFSCSCPHYHIKYTMCKHIHAVCRFIDCGSTSGIYEDHEPGISINTNELTNFTLVDAATRNIQDCKSSKERMLEKISIISKILSSNEIHEGTLTKVEKNVDNIFTLLTSDCRPSMSFKELSESKKEPSNKSVSQQVRFKSTKCKRKYKPALSKPDDSERDYIKFKLNNSTSDHNYCKIRSLFG